MSATGRSADTRSEDHRYDDIIDLPHHVSAIRPHMPLYDRAAQFSPFAALSGHEAALKETARLTEEPVELWTRPARRSWTKSYNFSGSISESARR